MEISIVQVASPAEIAEVRSLFEEYAASLNFSLCFQDFAHELSSLPGNYASPSGRLLLAVVASRQAQPAGCVAMRRIDPQTGELKCLYVRPEFRGQGIGRTLTQKIIEEAGEYGYSRLRLDTLDSMAEAQSLYRSLGFALIKPYRINPASAGDAICMELALD
ncbi:MAG TPA: GNAT family N-acetyltransferase [Terriglobia bacterium]|nr:GNAT family N-acetyltransferase [Terriglobia bacterium]